MTEGVGGAERLPVADAQDASVGTLTVRDLFARLRSRGHGWWQALLAIPPELAWEAWWQSRLLDAEGLVWGSRDTAGATFAHVMHPAPVTPRSGRPLKTTDEMLAREEIREAPVTVAGEPVGAHSRSDLVRVLARAPVPPEGALSDADLVVEMQGRIEREPQISNRGIWIDAKDGVIALTGLVADAQERAALGALARAIAGCKGVENHLLPREGNRRACA